MAPTIDLDGVFVSAALITPRFSRLLMLAWRRVPPEARTRIVRHWTDPRYQVILPQPVFALTPRPVDGGAAAVTSMCGFLLRFDARVVLEWDEERVEDLIGRQLALVHGDAVEAIDMSCYRWSEDALQAGERMRLALDEYARELSQAWGFEPVHDVV